MLLGPSKSSSERLNLTAKQLDAIRYLRDVNTQLLIAPTGSGKTTLLLHQIKQTQERWIIACPPSVVMHWPSENEKWELQQTIIPLVGSIDERLALMAKHPRADAFVISLQSLGWLLDQDHGCTAIVVDELSKASGKQGAKLKLKSNDKIVKRIGMTATPVSENFEKLYGMLRIIDKSLLGTRKEAYLNTYFVQTDFKGYNHALRPGADKLIMEKIKSSVYALDYVKTDELPPIEEIELEFNMPKEARKLYDTMRNELLLENGNPEDDVVAPNMAVMTSKLRQIASGFAKSISGKVVEYDRQRASEAVKWALDLEHLTGIIIYEFDHQRVQLEQMLSSFDLSYASVHGGTKSSIPINKFKRKQVQFLIAQQNTLSHGVDGLQHVCRNLMFYQPLWSADVTEQAIGRIWRQGQPKPVTVTYLIADDSIDDVVINRVNDKAVNMKMFMAHLKRK